MEMWRSNFISFLKAKFHLILVVVMLMANVWIKWCSFSSISILFNLLLPLSIIELLYFLLKLRLRVAWLHSNFNIKAQITLVLISKIYVVLDIFTYYIHHVSFEPHVVYLGETLLSKSYRCGNTDSERLGDITKLVGDTVRMWFFRI